MLLKLRLLLFVLVLNGLMVQAQGGPPPPCGLTPEYVCDDDLDGEVQVDLFQLFPFRFCTIPESNEQFYFPLTYYTSEDDAIAQMNPIANPENFITSTSDALQDIWRRADPIDPATHPVLTSYDPFAIVLPPTAVSPTPLIACDLDTDGFTEFNLFSKTAEILSGQFFGYGVRFFETYQDALDGINSLSSPYTNTTVNQQTIYAKVSNITRVQDYVCSTIVELELIVQGTCEDVEVMLINAFGPPRPGFTVEHELVYKNNGLNTVTSGTIVYIKDQNMVMNDAVGDGSDVITITSEGISVDFLNLEPAESRSVLITLTCPVETPLGEVINSSVDYITDTNDVNPNNHNPTLYQTVVGSWDPNDKGESHGREIIIDEFTNDDYLYYTIRFQNLGTADAINISIEDVLDSQLDPSTFQNLRLSHSGSVLRTGTNLTWTFNNINLPAEQDDSEASHGYVHFKIKPKSDYAVDDIIPNTASIFFDFNAPIITNTFETEFVADPTLSITPSQSSTFIIFPNPTKDIINISFNSNGFGNGTLSLLDIQGKQILIHKISDENRMIIDISDLQSGMYFIKVNMNAKTAVKKLVID
nr:T9SS type A sorting domain-containing protein [uncultured Psychroserpens sp.]